MQQPPLVTAIGLARMLGWPRSRVYYWLHATGIELTYDPGLPWGYVPRSAVDEVVVKLRAARAQRRHDGHGGGEARARRRHPGGVY